ncbi:MAG: protein-L-isoaspartate(D-aspartate) O-methyltransferase [Synechococcales cyanobacterium]
MNHLPWFSEAAQQGVVASDSGNPGSSTDLLDLARHRMVNEQIWQRGIRDERVLQAMMRVPRHRFVPDNLVDLAYSDRPLNIGYYQTISQPYIVAYMTEAAHVLPSSKVLEIGTGSGYQTAILSEIANEVYTVERIPALAEQADQVLQSLGYSNIHIRTGNGYHGWPEAAVYDAILVTAAPPHIPQELIDQLAVGGTLVIPIGRDDQSLLVARKTQQGLVFQKSLPVQFVPMI